MNIKFKQLIACLALVVTPELWASTTDTQTQLLSGTDKDNTVLWDFKLNAGRNSGEWKKIPVPSNWEMQGFGTYRYWNDWQKDPVPDTEGMYRHQFHVPADWRGKKIDIVFGAAMTDTQVKINGQLAGAIHQGGFYEFRYDVSQLVKVGESNLLEVTVNRYSANESVNRAERSSDYWLFSGIYRPVWLEAKPVVNIDRVTVDAKHTGDFSANVFIHGGAQEGDKIRAQVTTLDGKKLGKAFFAKVGDTQAPAQLHANINNIIPWSAENPQRYQVEFQLLSGEKVIHSLSKTIGFRTIEVRKQDGVYVNGKKIRLKGSNRHSIWPTSGRTTSKALSYQDVQLMKDMNMNAVRMSHYPPDSHFLDVADELGLYVIDELAGWQKFYDTDVATPLVKELVQRDQHHPSILFWANGNEGGFNRDLDKLYSLWDLQQRPVIHPWENFGGIDTAHYESYDCCATSLFHGRDVFMPTEFLHGLYDGGSGAGLADWWRAMLANPLSAGGFIWAFADEGIVRDDQHGAIDVSGNRGPDGIVGPYREKEGSYFAIKNIWSPVYLPLSELPNLAPSFDGNIQLENRYDFTNLNSLIIEWKLVKFNSLVSAENGFKVIAAGQAKAPNIAPGMRGETHLNLPSNWRGQDSLYVTVSDANGREIYTWSWMIANAQTVAQQTTAEWIAKNSSASQPAVTLQERADVYELGAKNLSVSIDKSTGYLRALNKNGVIVPLTNGPRLVTGKATLKSITAQRDADDVIVNADYTGNLRKIQWRLTPAGLLKLTYAYQMEAGIEVDYLGVSFDYPETQVTAMRWLGKGPYRVWKNRTQGVEFNVWKKDYNDTVTGLSWNYPEFKGFHNNVYWVEFATKNVPLRFINHSDDLAVRVFTPKEASGEGFEPKTTHVDFPLGDISFLNTIAPIGTKFRAPNEHGPAGQKSRIPRLGQWIENSVDIIVGDSQ